MPPARAATNWPAGAVSRMFSNQRNGSTVSSGAARASAAAPRPRCRGARQNCAVGIDETRVAKRLLGDVRAVHHPDDHPHHGPDQTGQGAGMSDPGVGGTIMAD